MIDRDRATSPPKGDAPIAIGGKGLGKGWPSPSRSGAERDAGIRSGTPGTASVEAGLDASTRECTDPTTAWSPCSRSPLPRRERVRSRIRGGAWGVAGATSGWRIASVCSSHWFCSCFGGGGRRIGDIEWRTATVAGRTTTRKRPEFDWHRACYKGGHGGGGGGGTSLLHPSTSSSGDVCTPGFGEQPGHLRRVASGGSAGDESAPRRGNRDGRCRWALWKESPAHDSGMVVASRGWARRRLVAGARPPPEFAVFQAPHPRPRSLPNPPSDLGQGTHRPLRCPPRLHRRPPLHCTPVSCRRDELPGSWPENVREPFLVRCAHQGEVLPPPKPWATIPLTIERLSPLIRSLSFQGGRMSRQDRCAGYRHGIRRTL